MYTVDSTTPHLAPCQLMGKQKASEKVCNVIAPRDKNTAWALAIGRIKGMGSAGVVLDH